MYVKKIDKSCLTNPAANSSFNGISFSTVKKKKNQKSCASTGQSRLVEIGPQLGQKNNY